MGVYLSCHNFNAAKTDKSHKKYPKDDLYFQTHETTLLIKDGCFTSMVNLAFLRHEVVVARNCLLKMRTMY